jgi:hypothetical protein
VTPAEGAPVFSATSFAFICQWPLSALTLRRFHRYRATRGSVLNRANCHRA